MSRCITEKDVLNAVDMVDGIVTEKAYNKYMFLLDSVHHLKGIYIYRKGEQFKLNLIKHVMFQNKRDLYDVLCTFYRTMLYAGTENNVEALLDAIIVKDNRIVED